MTTNIGLHNGLRSTDGSSEGDHAHGVRNLPGRSGAMRVTFQDLPPDMPHQSRDGAGVETIAGGALRITHGQHAEETPYINGPATRVHGGALRFNAGYGEPETIGVARHVVDHAGHEGGSIMATIRNDGPSQSVELIPGNPASRTTIEVALREGLVRRGADGSLVDARGTDGAQRTLATVEAEKATVQAQQQQAAQQAHDEATDGVFREQEDQDFAKDMADVPEAAFKPAMAKAISALALDGDMEEAAAGRLMENGMEPERAAQAAAQGVEYLQGIADRAVIKAGVPQDRLGEFYESLRSNPNALMGAVQALAFGRSVTKFQEAARVWAAGAGVTRKAEG